MSKQIGKNYLDELDRRDIMDRLFEALNLIGVDEDAFFDKIAMSESGAYKLKKGINQITADKLSVIVNYFGISSDFLLSGNVANGMYFHECYQLIKDMEPKQSIGIHKGIIKMSNSEFNKDIEMNKSMKTMNSILDVVSEKEKVELIADILEMCLKKLK